jgi:cytidine deaminase
VTTIIDWDGLREAAERVAKRAYAPYSKFQVGAALLCADGRVFSGCNVENASFGLTICAERNAVFGAVAGDARSFSALAVVSSAAAPVTPCGACRQVLIEFAPDFPVRCYGLDGSVLDSSSCGLLPHAFASDAFLG